MKLISFLIGILLCAHLSGQQIECLSNEFYVSTEQGAASSLSDMKVVRINFHFMLKSDGSGNFTETTDGNGSSDYNGYMYARDLTAWMNNSCAWNPQMNLPPGNTTPVIDKNFSFVLDAVYFWRNSNTYNYQTINYTNQGQDKDSVLNIFLSHANGVNQKIGGYASNPDENSKVKYTENRFYWQQYIFNLSQNYPMTWLLHGTGSQTLHELGHLLGLSHTVQWNNAPPCPTGCPIDSNNYPGAGPINPFCDDGCSDTPAAWEITNIFGCDKHPNCGWGNSGPHCSNNLMDYTGSAALTPCQIGKIHSHTENGMRSYLMCAALETDKTLCDIGYPKTSYFGKSLTIGCPNNTATVSTREKISLYFSEEVNLSLIEVESGAEFEIIRGEVCGF